MNKKVHIFLDFDCVLNNFELESRKDRYEEICFNKNNVKIFTDFLKELDKTYGEDSYIITLNTAWKVNCGNTLITRLQEKLPKCTDLDGNLRYLISKFKDTTPTYRFYEKGYNCKSFEVESYIVMNYKYYTNKIKFIYIDDSIGDFKYINVYQLNTDIMKGFVEKDKYELLDVIENFMLGGDNYED